MKIRLIGDEPLLAALGRLGPLWEGEGGLLATTEVERRLGLRLRARVEDGHGGGPADGGSDRLFAGLTLRRPPPNHYAPAAVLAVHRTRIAARGLAAMGAAVLLGGVAWSGSAWNRTLDLATATEALHREATAYERRRHAERLPESAIDLHDVRRAVETAQRLDAARARALPVFQAVSGALEGFPDLRLESLEWFEISDRDEWPPPRNENGPREGYRIAHLRGRLDPFDGHYRAAADEVFRFAEALEEVPRLSGAEVLDLPENPGGSGYRHPHRAGFEIKVVLDVRGD